MTVMATSTIHVGDALQVLRTLPDSSVHCCVTSPPYWGLRDYGTPGQIGHEQSPDVFVDVLVAVFAEVRRLLRPTGVLWLNLGDSYCTPAGGSAGVHSGIARHREGGRTMAKGAKGLKPKDLVGIPWRVALALQADGWWLRSDCVWHKPNPMPESTKDRPTKAHEYVFLLSKSQQHFFDEEDVRDGATQRSPGLKQAPKGADQEAMRTRGGGPHAAAPSTTRRPTTVWTIAPQPFRGAHFATFPEELARRCVLSGTSGGGACPACGTPLRRVVRKGEPNLEHQRACGGDASGEYRGQATKDFASAGAENASAVKARILAGMRERETVGWVRQCKPTCVGGSAVPCVVLDPFAGAGTTGVVAARFGRSFLGIELNPEYAAMAERRIAAVAPLFVRQSV